VPYARGALALLARLGVVHTPALVVDATGIRLGPTRGRHRPWSAVHGVEVRIEHTQHCEHPGVTVTTTYFHVLDSCLAIDLRVPVRHWTVDPLRLRAAVEAFAPHVRCWF
jgi:hypothetical protein